MAMLRLRGSIYFGAVDHVRQQLQQVDEADPKRKWVLLLAQGINFVDLEGAHWLGQESQRRRALGGGLFLVGAQPAILQALAQPGVADAFGPGRLLAHKGDALRALYPLLDSDICRNCQVRAFEECQTILPNGELRTAHTPDQVLPNRSDTP